MIEPTARSANVIPNGALPQPTLATGLSDDDDEPASRNSFPQYLSQVTSRRSSSSSIQFAGQSPQPAPSPSPPPSKWTSVKQRLRTLFTPTHPLGPEPTYVASFKAAVFYTPLNLCLLFIPVSWALHYTHQSATLVFVFSALGIVPLAALLGFGTEQIALKTSMSVGGLLNATLGNIVEMIIAGIALGKCELELVQSSLLGGLLSNLLLVLGMAFVVGGARFKSQEFQPMVAQLNSSLMIVSVISLIVPSALHEFLGDRLPQGEEVDVLLRLSRGSALILICIYAVYLFFQFYSHTHLFLDTNSDASTVVDMSINTYGNTLKHEHLPLPNTTTIGSDQEPEHVKMNTKSALVLLVVVTAFAYLTAEFLVDSLNGLVESHPSISKEWITLIIIPIISNAAEHTTAVVVAHKGKFDLAMSVAVGSCIQIALFVIPLLVIIAWGMGKPLTLLFDSLETLTLFLSVLLVKFSIEDGRAHYLSGVALIGVYLIIAISFWNFPDVTRLIQGQPLACS